MCLRIRAHHGLCIQFFEGKGYDADFTAHMKQVIEMLKKNPTKDKVMIIAEEDVICQACPNLRPEGCHSRKLAASYDSKVLRLCEIETNVLLTWEIFEALVWEKIIKAKRMTAVCSGCQWQGICHNLNMPSAPK